MPTLEANSATAFVKCLLLGDSGTGKTGALASLANAGYSLIILDMDVGLDPLRKFTKPDCLKNISYESRRDKYKAGPAGMGPIIDGQPKAYVEALRLLDKWSDGRVPAEAGDKTVFVLDSLTHFSRAAFAWAEVFKGSKDPRAVYGEAQKAVEHNIALLTSETFESHVIVISHVDYQERDDGVTKGFPTSVGKALGPKIPTYFNSMILAEEPTPGKRQIRTSSTPMVSLKSPVNFGAPLPIESGLAKFFEQIRG